MFTEQSAIEAWSQILHFNIWTEKIPNKGEDAPPSLLFHLETQLAGLLAVYDGMGGAGSAAYLIEGSTFTGAFIASRLAKKVTEEFFHVDFPETRTFDINELKYVLQKDFEVFAQKLESQGSSKLKSKMIRKLPTTLAGSLFQIRNLENKNIVVDVNTFWAGDSRCYLLKQKGLKQLTTDDLTNQGDALDNLINDAPISNCVNAEIEFVLHTRELTVQEPFMLIAATDGCFNYLSSPAHFEYILLDTLLQKDTLTLEDWKDTLQLKLQALAADDVSLSMVMIGFGNNINSLKKYFANRFKQLWKQSIEPLQTIEDEIKSLLEKENYSKEQLDALQLKRNTVRRSLWESYRRYYEG